MMEQIPLSKFNYLDEIFGKEPTMPANPTSEAMKLYEQTRMECLRYGNVHPESTMGCHDAIKHANHTQGFVRFLAQRIDEIGRALTSEPVAGWKLVPIEPTEEMIEAGILKCMEVMYGGVKKQLVDGMVSSITFSCVHEYKAMIEAAPPHTETERG